MILFLMGMMFPNPTLAKKKDKKKTDALKVLTDKPKETGGIEDYNKAIKAVSYTHLDVYKRQDYHGKTDATPQHASPSCGGSTFESTI